MASRAYSSFMPEEQDQGVNPDSIQFTGQPSGSRPWTPGANRKRTVNNYTGDDPVKAAENDRLRALNYGDVFDDDFSEGQSHYSNLGTLYRGAADEAFEGLRDRPGYDPEIESRLMDESGYRRGMTTDDEFAGNFMSESEQAGAYGNPWERNRAFDPGKLDTISREGQGWRRQAYSAGADAARGANQQATAAGRASLDQGDDRTFNAIDAGEGKAFGEWDRTEGKVNDGLGDYESKYGGVASGLEGKYGSIIDPAKLGISDRQVELMKDAAGRTVGAAYGTSRDNLYRNAEAAGNVNPLALASAETKLNRGMSGEMADAISDAELKGVEAQRNANKDIAGMQMEGATNVAGISERGTRAIGDGRLGASMTIGQGRVGTADVFGRTRAGYMDSRSNARTGFEGQAGDRAVGLESTLQGRNIGVEDQNAREGNDNIRYQTDTGINIGRDIDNTQVDRSRYITQNRQDVNMANQQNRYTQNTGTEDRVRQGYQTVGDQRVAGQTARRNYLQQQGNYNTDVSEKYPDRRISAYGQTAGMQSEGTGRISAHKTNNPGFMRSVGNAALQAGVAAVGGAAGNIGRKSSN